MEQLGIQPSLLLAQIFNFGLIIFVMSKLLYKPILGMLEKRKQEIEAGLKLTENLRLEEEKLKERHAKLTEKAKAEARKIVDDARAEGKLEAKRIISEAHGESALIIEKAKAEIRKEKEAMTKGIQTEAVDMAVAMTRRLTASVLSEKDQRTLIAKNLKAIETVQVSH